MCRLSLVSVWFTGRCDLQGGDSSGALHAASRSASRSAGPGPARGGTSTVGTCPGVGHQQPYFGSPTSNGNGSKTQQPRNDEHGQQDGASPDDPGASGGPGTCAAPLPSPPVPSPPVPGPSGSDPGAGADGGGAPAGGAGAGGAAGGAAGGVEGAAAVAAL